MVHANESPILTGLLGTYTRAVREVANNYLIVLLLQLDVAILARITFMFIKKDKT